jgi:hypothetical protein
MLPICASSDKHAIEEDFGAIIRRDGESRIPCLRRDAESFAEERSRGVRFGMPNPLRGLR